MTYSCPVNLNARDDIAPNELHALPTQGFICEITLIAWLVCTSFQSRLMSYRLSREQFLINNGVAIINGLNEAGKDPMTSANNGPLYLTKWTCLESSLILKVKEK